MKKLKIIVIAMVVSLVIPSSTFASSMESFGEWDHQGSDFFTSESKIFLSGGGDFKICLEGHSPTGYYTLYEEDPWNPDDKVKSSVTFDGATSKTDGFHYEYADIIEDNKFYCHIFSDVNGYVDGDQAEFYVKKNNSGDEAFVEAWD
jgi:hypothetical protein